MARPVILTIDDDPDVLRAIERDFAAALQQRAAIASALTLAPRCESKA